MEDKFICRYCGMERKNANSLRNHERLCKSNPNRQILVSNFIAWNQKKRDLHLKGENQYTKAKRLGLPKPILTKETREKLSRIHKGKPLSEEIKQKISNTQKKNYEGHKCCWSTAVEHRLSYAEQYFIPVFNNAVLHYHVSRYFLDFAWPEKKIYVEVDGTQHKYDKRVVEHDKERTQNLIKLGWVLVSRIYWPDFVKLNLEEREEFIYKIKDKINNWNVSPQAYTL